MDMDVRSSTFLPFGLCGITIKCLQLTLVFLISFAFIFFFFFFPFLFLPFTGISATKFSSTHVGKFQQQQ